MFDGHFSNPPKPIKRGDRIGLQFVFGLGFTCAVGGIVLLVQDDSLWSIPALFSGGYFMRRSFFPWQ